MEIKRVTNRNEQRTAGRAERRREESTGKIEIVTVNGNPAQSGAPASGQKDGDLSAQVAQQEQQVARLEDQLRVKRERVADLQREREAVSDEIVVLEEQMELLRDSAHLAQERVDELTRRCEELQRMEQMTDAELQAYLERGRGRLERLAQQDQVAHDDLKKDLEQLAQMKGSEFVDPVALEALKQKYDKLGEDLRELQRELSRISADAAKKGDDRTKALNAEQAGASQRG